MLSLYINSGTFGKFSFSQSDLLKINIHINKIVFNFFFLKLITGTDDKVKPRKITISTQSAYTGRPNVHALRGLNQIMNSGKEILG